MVPAFDDAKDGICVLVYTEGLGLALRINAIYSNIFLLLLHEENSFWYIFCSRSDDKEHCGFHDAHTPLDSKTSEQLGQYLFLLKLSLLYTPRAIVANVSASRDFVFTVECSCLFFI